MVRLVVCITVVFLVPTPILRAVTIDLITIGHAGNPADFGNPTFPGLGSVPYEFRLAKYELTNVQYVEFLNIKAKTDPFDLYDPRMTSDPRSGILRTDGPSGFVYSVKPDMGNKPV